MRHGTIPSVTHLAPGTVIAGRFVLERLLGEGGVGAVWAARNVVTRKGVALKFLRKGGRDEATRARFMREARATCAIVHPHVIAVHDVLPHEGLPVMVLDLLEGESLASRLRREGRLPLEKALEVLVQIALALEAVHLGGIIHRDLKPDNVFLEARARSVDAEEHIHVKVLDFGLARFTVVDPAAHALTQTGAMMGSPIYMSPEQAFGERDLDARSDLWALGIVMYECLTGVCPTRGENIGQIFKKVTSTPLVPIDHWIPNLPEGVIGVVGRLLQRDRNERPASAKEVRLQLESQLARLREGPLSRRPAGRRRSARLAVAVPLAVCVGVVAVFAAIGMRRSHAPASPGETLQAESVSSARLPALGDSQKVPASAGSANASEAASPRSMSAAEGPAPSAGDSAKPQSAHAQSTRLPASHSNRTAPASPSPPSEAASPREGDLRPFMDSRK